MVIGKKYLRMWSWFLISINTNIKSALDLNCKGRRYSCNPSEGSCFTYFITITGRATPPSHRWAVFSAQSDPNTQQRYLLGYACHSEKQHPRMSTQSMLCWFYSDEHYGSHNWPLERKITCIIVHFFRIYAVKR